MIVSLRSTVFGLLASTRTCCQHLVHASSAFSYQSNSNERQTRWIVCTSARCYSLAPDLQPKFKRPYPSPKPDQITDKWLREQFVISPGFAIPSHIAYARYKLHCPKGSRQRVPLTDSHFGRRLRSHFSGLGLVRKQFRTGKSWKCHYINAVFNPAVYPDGAKFIVCANVATHPTPAMVNWLHDTFGVKRGHATSCGTAYDVYRWHCKESHEEPLSIGSFGKLIQSVFGLAGVEWKLLGAEVIVHPLRTSRGSYYWGLRLKTLPPGAEECIEVNVILPDRWEDLCSAEIISADSQPAALRSDCDELREVAKDYEDLQQSHLESVIGTTKSVSVPLASGKTLSFNCAIDPSVLGMISADLTPLCDILSDERGYDYPRHGVYKCWYLSLDDEQKARSFVEGIPGIKGRLTSHGLRHLLRYCAESSWHKNSRPVYAACVEQGIISPLERLPVAIKIEVQTIARLLAIFQRRKSTGSATDFSYYNPHDPEFTVPAYADDVSQIIRHRAKVRGVLLVEDLSASVDATSETPLAVRGCDGSGNCQSQCSKVVGPRIDVDAAATLLS